MGLAESQWDSSLAEEYQRELNLQRTREYQRLVNDCYNRYLDAYQYAMLYGTGTVGLAKKLQETMQPENFDEEKLLAEEDF